MRVTTVNGIRHTIIGLLVCLLAAAAVVATAGTTFAVTGDLTYTAPNAWDPTTATLNQSTDISTNSSSPLSAIFNPEGSKMYVSVNSASEVHEYSLTVPFDTSTASYVDFLSVTSTLKVGMLFNDNGSKFYVVDYVQNDIDEYTLVTPYDISTGTYVTNFVFTAQDGNPHDVVFNADGTVMTMLGNATDTLYVYSLSTGFDLTTATYSSTSYTLASLGASGTYPGGIEFALDGTKFYYFDAGSTKRIHAYDLSTAYDLSSTSSIGTLDVGGTASFALDTNSLGTVFYLSSNGTHNVFEYAVDDEYPEAVGNDGSIDSSQPLTINLSGDTFQDTDADDILDVGSEVAVNNVPAGLTPVVTLSNSDTTATLTFSGQATAHQDADDTSSGLSFVFDDTAFVGGDASMITNSGDGGAYQTTIDFDFDDGVFVELSSAASSGYEAADNNRQTLLVNGTVSAATTVDVTASAPVTDPATLGVDYSFAPNPMTVTIPVGIYDGTAGTAVSIPGWSITDEATIEADEGIILTLSNPTGQATLADSNGDTSTTTVGTYTILDDDAPVGFCSAGTISVTRTSFDEFVIDDDTSPELNSAYASYRITTGASDSFDDLWVRIDNFSSPANLDVAPNEDGLYHIGAVGSSANADAYLYLTGAISGSAQTYDISLFEGHPSFGGTQDCYEQLSNSMVVDEIKANANKVTSVEATAPYVGGIMTMTVRGETGTMSSTRPEGGVFSYSPASLDTWPADCLELVDTSITFTGGNTGTYNDGLVVTGLNSPATDYVVSYIYRITCVTASPTPVSPVNYISSGNTNLKHTDVDTAAYLAIPPVPPAENRTFVTKAASPGTLLGGGVVTYTVTIHNESPIPVRLDQIQDTLASSPGTTSYVANSSMYGGTPFSEPDISGQVLTWSGDITVAANSTETLTYQVAIPATVGAYSNSAIGIIDTTQIDQTIDTTDNVPATVDVSVGDPNLSGSTLSYTDQNGGNIEPGDVLEYTVTIDNSGTGPATGIDLIDTIDPNTQLLTGIVVGANGSDCGSSYADTSTVSAFNITDLEAGVGSSCIITYEVTVLPAINDNENILSTIDISAPNEGGNPVTVSATPIIVDLYPNITVTKTDTDVDNSVAPGEVVTYTITLSNTGDTTANGIDVADVVSGPVSLIDNVTFTNCGVYSEDVISGANIDIINASVEVGLDCVITYDATIDSAATPGQTVTNTSDASVANEGGNDPASIAADTLTVDPGDPTANDDSADVIKDSTTNIIDWDDNDSLIDGATLFVVDPTSVQGGTVTDNANGTFSYTPPAAFTGSDSLTYQICDDDTPTASCDSATVTITVSEDIDNDGNPDAIDPDDDQDGIDDAIEAAGPNGGDANGDGTPDNLQADVATLPNAHDGGRYVSLHTTGGDCGIIDSFGTTDEISLAAQSSEFDFPLGLFDFEIICNNPGDSTTVTFYLDSVYDTSDWTFIKYDRNVNTYEVFDDRITYSTASVGGTTVTTMSYQLTDGQYLDEDLDSNARIVDPAGPALPGSSLSETGVGIIEALAVGIGIIAIAQVVNRLTDGGKILK